MRLAINIDHVATVRNARGGNEPDPVVAAEMAERAGAQGIVCHLREDRRHIKDRDLMELRKRVKTKLDLEMGASEEIVTIALRTKPDLVTLVPERRKELTTEGGLDVVAQKQRLTEVISEFRRISIPVSLFVDPVPAQIEASKAVGAELVEIHTGEYANAGSPREAQIQRSAVEAAAKLGKSLGMGVNAGHGLNYLNTAALISIREIDEVSIGHAVITRALFVGIGQAVREMLAVISGSRAALP